MWKEALKFLRNLKLQTFLWKFLRILVMNVCGWEARQLIRNLLIFLFHNFCYVCKIFKLKSNFYFSWKLNFNNSFSKSQKKFFWIFFFCFDWKLSPVVMDKKNSEFYEIHFQLYLKERKQQKRKIKIFLNFHHVQHAKWIW